MSTNNPSSNQPLAKRTPAQLALIHTGESVLLTVLLGLVGSIYQFIGSHGFNLHDLIPFIGGTFIGALSMIYKTLSSNPNLGPAFADTVNQFKAEIQLLLASHLQGVAQIIGQVTGNVPQASLPVQQSQPIAQAVSNPWGTASTNTLVPGGQQVSQQQFPPLPQFTIPQAAISSSQAQQQPGQPQ